MDIANFAPIRLQQPYNDVYHSILPPNVETQSPSMPYLSSVNDAILLLQNKNSSTLPSFHSQQIKSLFQTPTLEPYHSSKTTGRFGVALSTDDPERGRGLMELAISDKCQFL